MNEVYCGLKYLMTRTRSIIAVVIFLVTSACCVGRAQHKTTDAIKSQPVAQSGAVSGRVFLITRSGDLKPARLASVWIFSFAGGAKSSAAAIWLDEYQKASEKWLAELKAHTEWSDSRACLEEINTWTTSVLNALPRLLPSQYRSADADEDGIFKISDVRPAEYYIFVAGRAGFNKAFWRGDFDVVSGKETMVKLSTPEKACLVTE